MKTLKRTITLLLAVCLLVSCCGVEAGAVEPRSSNYFAAYGAHVTVIGDGKITITGEVDAVHTMTRLGVTRILFYKSDGTYIKTVYGSISNGLLRDNSPFFAADYTFQGNSGTPHGDYISGGSMAAPVAGDLIVSVLDYLDYGKQYSAEELANASVEVPNVVGYDLDEAREICEAAGFDYRVVGDGDDYNKVEYQVAKAGSYIPKGSQITLYIAGEEPPGSVTVPDLEGLSASEARGALRDAGLYMESTGVSTSSSSYARVYSQSVDAGEEVAPGTVVTVAFRDTSDTEDDGGIVD